MAKAVAQRGDGVINGWATGPVRIGLFLGDEAVVPAQDRARGAPRVMKSAITGSAP